MTSLEDELQHDIKSARESGNHRYANRLQSILDADDPAETLKRVASGNHKPDELKPFLGYVEAPARADGSITRPTFEKAVREAAAMGNTDRLDELQALADAGKIIEPESR